ncbi:uncharacterized protein MKZ38_009951 [Zalerion maritima]|uniref:Major facilitator superfamily (MFS) profile domain-containing protein n=1 Tax=Zalerion maritima TaxID=339359 RepID=A0AAD5RGK6_9PEZI|nr:uncharacterized protein MKZ38_009951 [Zalerion maritima]
MEILPEPVSPRTRGPGRTYGRNSPFHNFYNDYSHIADPNLRRRLALSEIDKVPFGWNQVRTVAVTGVGFFIDSYDIFSINLILIFLGLVFYQGSPDDPATHAYGYGGNHGHLPISVSQAIKTSTSAGIIIGQILFGWLADVFGRRRMYGVELGIIVVSTLCCALVSPSPSVSFVGLMVFWRVMMGAGIGGDYPLSSVITSEFAPTRWRGGMIAAVFSMQGIGQLFAAIAALIVTVGFKDSFISIADSDSCDEACQLAADHSWRIIVGVGAVPAVFALYYRVSIPETPRFTFDVSNDVEKADADIRAYIESKSEGKVDKVKQARSKMLASPSLKVPKASWNDFAQYFGQWKNAKVLIGTTLSWFFLDLAFFGLGINTTIVLQAIGYSAPPQAPNNNMYNMLHTNAIGTIILTCAGSIPGYILSIFLIDTVGRKPLQILGFFFLTIIFAVMGFWYHSLSSSSLLALYILAQFLFNLGPNTTTFVIPGECFPTRYRSTAHGFSAAMGKVGAIIAQVISVPLLARGAPPDHYHDCPIRQRQDRTEGDKGDYCTPPPWLDKLMQLFALFMLLGFLVSFLLPETKGITLEELSGEAPTSYNAGRNGSVGPSSALGKKPFCQLKRKLSRNGGASQSPDAMAGVGRGRTWTVWAMARRWNPFAGGQPAGFNYPRERGYWSSSSTGNVPRQRRRIPGFGFMGNADSSPDHITNAVEMTDQSSRRGRSRLRTLFRNRSRRGREGSWMSDSRINGENDEAISPTRASNSRTAGAVGGGEMDVTEGVGVLGAGIGSAGGIGAVGTGGIGGVGVPATGGNTLDDGDTIVPAMPAWGAGWGRIDRGPTPMDGIRLQDVGSLLKQ